MKLGFVFSGQGSQNIGMGKDLYDNYEEYRKIYEKASYILGIDIAGLTFLGSEEELSRYKKCPNFYISYDFRHFRNIKNK